MEGKIHLQVIIVLQVDLLQGAQAAQQMGHAGQPVLLQPDGLQVREAGQAGRQTLIRNPAPAASTINIPSDDSQGEPNLPPACEPANHEAKKGWHSYVEACMVQLGPPLLKATSGIVCSPLDSSSAICINRAYMGSRSSPCMMYCGMWQLSRRMLTHSWYSEWSYVQDEQAGKAE